MRAGSSEIGKLDVLQKLVPRDSKVLLDDLVEKSRADLFAGMMRYCGSPSVRMFVHHVAAGCVAVDESKSFDDLGQLLAGQAGEFRQELHLDLLHSHKLFRNLRWLISLEVGLDGLFCPGEKFIHRLGLGVAAGQSDYLRHEPAVLISFDHNCVFSWHGWR